MPRARRYAFMSARSVMERFSSGILIKAIASSSRSSRCGWSGPQFASNRFEQELQNLHVALRLFKRFTPRVKPVAAKKQRVRPGIRVERRRDLAPEARHVLVIPENGNPLAMLVRRDAVKPLEHL